MEEAGSSSQDYASPAIAGGSGSSPADAHDQPVGGRAATPTEARLAGLAPQQLHVVPPPPAIPGALLVGSNHRSLPARPGEQPQPLRKGQGEVGGAEEVYDDGGQVGDDAEARRGPQPPQQPQQPRLPLPLPQQPPPPPPPPQGDALAATQMYRYRPGVAGADPTQRLLLLDLPKKSATSTAHLQWWLLIDAAKLRVASEQDGRPLTLRECVDGMIDARVWAKGEDLELVEDGSGPHLRQPTYPGAGQAKPMKRWDKEDIAFGEARPTRTTEYSKRAHAHAHASVHAHTHT